MNKQEMIIICDSCNDLIPEKEEYFTDTSELIYCWCCLEGTGLTLSDIRLYYESKE